MRKIKETLASIVLAGATIIGLSGEVNAESRHNKRCFDFNGYSSKVVIEDSQSLDTISTNKGLTVSAWFKIDSHPRTENTIVSKWGPSNDSDDEWTLNIMQNGSLEFYLNSATTPHGSPDTILNSGFPVSINEWHHGVGVWDGEKGIAELYLDRTLVSSTNSAIRTMPNTSQALCIGYGHYGSGFHQYFDGRIDKVKIFNYPLTPLKNKRNFLVGYWKFDEKRGEVAEDSSDNGNDGIIYDAERVRD